ncbi:hypothetical protein DFS34DRAFT_94050 [Phlyctochytrium arcticum]|nr:hypothetical protein DFS34DRAFT_94050 [Phlyctochytrium arcticum]
MLKIALTELSKRIETVDQATAEHAASIPEGMGMPIYTWRAHFASCQSRSFVLSGLNYPLHVMTEKTPPPSSGTVVPIIKMDDFNRVAVHGTPGSANSGKFSTVQTQANLAVKIFPKGLSSHDEDSGYVQRALPIPLPEKPYIDFSSWESDAKKKLFVKTPLLAKDIIDLIGKESYGEKLLKKNGPDDFRTPYHFDMSTSAAELKNFHIFDAIANRMKTPEDVRTLMLSVIKFIMPYKDGLVWIVGDFYVWRNVMKWLWCLTRTPLSKDHAYLRVVLCPWPDAMHIALNAQQALLQWNFNVFMPIWSSAFPDFAVQLVKLRPVRRMMLLTMMFLAWKRCRVTVMNWAREQRDLPEFQRVLIESLIRLFDEELPLVLDAATAMASGNITLYKEVLHRLLPLFIRYRKKNYVIIVLHILSTIQEFEASGDAEIIAALHSNLPLASSEDLEVFHSLLRACIRPFDSHGRAVLTTLFLSSNKNLSARSFLAQVAKQKAADRKKRKPWTRYASKFSISPRQPVKNKKNEYFDGRLEVLVSTLTKMFRKLTANSDNIEIEGEMMFSHSATTTKVRGYVVRYKVPPTQASTTEPARKRRKKITKISQFTSTPPEIIVTVSERLLPLALWGDKKVALNIHTDISAYAGVERITDGVNSAQQKKKFYTKASTFSPNPSSPCHCSPLDQNMCIHLKQFIAESEFVWWMYNLSVPLTEDDFVREDGEDVEITEEL